jgi:hypothetical protein
MTRLGETFQPLTDTANSMWTSIKIGALDLLNNAVKPLIKALQEAGALGQKARGNAGYENLGGDAKVNRLIANLGDGKSPKAYRTYKAQMAEFDRYANSLKFKIAAFGDDKSGVAQSAVAKLQTELAGVLTMRMEYDRRAQELHKKATAKNIEANKEEEQSIDSLKKKLAELQEQRKKAIAAGDTDLSKNLLKQINQVKADIKGLGGTTTTTTHKPTTAEQIAFDINKAGISSTKGVDTMPSVHGMLGDKGLRQMLGISAPAFDLGRDISEKDYKKLPGYDKNKDRDEKKLTEQISKLTSGISSITGGIKAMGFNLPNEVEQVIGVVQGVMAVIEGVNSVISIFGSTSMALNTIALDANTAALWAVAGTNLIPGLARGGIVPHAAGGYLIPGNNNSGDNVFAGGAWVNSGELVLSKAQQGNLASQLSGNGLQNLHLTATVHAEQIRLALNNNGQRTGRGELVTWKR